MNEQEIKELIVLAHMHKAGSDDQTLRFAELARQVALALSEANRRIRQYQSHIDRMLDDAPVRDLPETELERYAQTSPAWMFRWLVEAEAKIKQLEAAGEYEPVNDCINIGMARTLQVDGQNVCLWDYIEAVEFVLPDDVCIMQRRRPQPQEVQ